MISYMYIFFYSDTQMELYWYIAQFPEQTVHGCHKKKDVHPEFI